MGAIIALALIASFPVTLHAQVNIEQLRVTPAGNGVSGTGGASFAARTGNVELVLLNLEGRAEYEQDRWLAFVVGNLGLGWEAGTRFSSQGLLHGRFDYRLSPLVVAEAFAQTDYDEARLLSFRTVAGLGPRFVLADGVRWRVAIGTDYMFEHERLDLPAGSVHPHQTNLSRWSNYLSLRYGDGKQVAITMTGYAQPAFSDFGNIRVLGDARIAVKLAGALALTVASNVRYDSRPPDGIRSLDTTTRTGLSIAW